MEAAALRAAPIRLKYGYLITMTFRIRSIILIECAQNTCEVSIPYQRLEGVFMATLNFIRGKIGQFVGSSWKGKSYIKTFTKPGNPRTADQVAVRTVFLNVSRIAKSLYEKVLKPFTFPKPKRQTAYNRMIQINKPMFEGKVFDPVMLKIFEGPLNNPGITSAVLENAGTANEDILLSYPIDTGEKTDNAVMVIYDETTGTTLFTEGKRDDGEIEVKLKPISPVDPAKLHAYLVFSQPPTEGTGEKGLVSGTAYKKIA
jgi:hypothetical protein